MLSGRSPEASPREALAPCRHPERSRSISSAGRCPLTRTGFAGGCFPLVSMTMQGLGRAGGVVLNEAAAAVGDPSTSLGMTVPLGMTGNASVKSSRPRP
jgi:hypothetical protein